MPMGVYDREKSKPRPKTSLETREKMSKTRKNNHLNPLEFKKGHVPYNKGKSPSEETRNRMSESGRNKVFTEEHRKHLRESAIKKSPVTMETRRKMGFSRIGKKRLDMIGEKNPNYKGGITPENFRIRNSSEMKILKKKCFLRDNFTCQKYCIKGGYLVAHHINNFADFPELRLVFDNVVTLSKKAHDEFHHIYGSKNNTREQLEEFLGRKLGTVV